MTVVTLQTRINQLRETREALAQQVAAAEQDNRKMEEEIANLNTDEAIKAIARERLNLVEDGEMIFVDSSN
ncbi:MAG: septum formation initiator family protein [Oscillospiraceae bacterium]|nr:septum formation initiator family protein [Oscillospiraceae bacterium]